MARLYLFFASSDFSSAGDAFWLCSSVVLFFLAGKD